MKTKLLVWLLVGWASVAFGAQNVVVLLDDSGSMEEQMRGQSIRRIDAAKDALLTVLAQLPADANVGVLALNGSTGNGQWIIELGPVDKSNIRGAVEQIRAGGGTPLGTFLKEATDALLELRAKQIYGTYRLLVVTDGEANDGNYLNAVLPDVLSRNIVVDVIGVDMANDHSLATQVDTYRRADDPASLTQAISESLAEVNDALGDESGADYDLLEGLPDESALAIISALGTNSNNPITPAAELFDTPHHLQPVHSTSTHVSTGPSPVAILAVFGFLAFSVIVIVSKMLAGQR
ncbi:MAG: VWA domain-containing protein [Planctomycetales bacterium]|nr:VWA domain-containing protein [Planctomycetales bacterium]